MISLPSLANIASLLALMLVIFAVLGVTFFYNVRPDQDPYGRLGEHCNYVSFDSALWTLHRQTTGEGWNGIMYYSRSDDPYRACDKRYGGYLGDGCGGAALSIAYHVLWQLFGTYVLMQLFTAVTARSLHFRAPFEHSRGVAPSIGCAPCFAMCGADVVLWFAFIMVWRQLMKWCAAAGHSGALL